LDLADGYGAGDEIADVAFDEEAWRRFGQPATPGVILIAELTEEADLHLDAAGTGVGLLDLLPKIGADFFQKIGIARLPLGKDLLGVLAAENLDDAQRADLAQGQGQDADRRDRRQPATWLGTKVLGQVVQVAGGDGAHQARQGLAGVAAVVVANRLAELLQG